MHKRPFVLGILVLGLWAIVALWVAPQTIRAGYEGRSAAFINDVFGGRDVHPVDFYLQQWRSLAWAATAALVGVLGLAWLGVRYADRRRRLIVWIVGGEPSLARGAFVWYGVLLSLLGGLLQAVYAGVRQALVHMPASGFRREFFWMMPVSSALAGLVVALLVASLARAGASRVGVWKATLLFGFVVVYSVIQSDGIPLDPRAEVVLALGMAAVVARAVAPRPLKLERLVRRGPHVLLGAAVVLGLVAVVSWPAGAERLAAIGREPASGRRPNVLLVVLDTVRASNLSLYGYDRPTTPRLDEWARTGVVFERALTTSSWTLPAHATIFTGRYHYELGTGPRHPLDDGVPVLADFLRNRGYATAGFAANPGYTTPTSGLARGFDRYQAQRLSPSSLFGSSWLSGSLLDLVGVENDKGWKTGSQVTDEFLDWLDSRDDERPFFTFLNFFDAHDPYDAPEPFHTLFGPSAWDGPLSDLNDQWRQFSDRFGRSPDDPETRRQLSRWMNQYDGAIAYVDHQLGLIHDALEARGLLEDTLVVVVGDHGENWGEHGLIEHGVALYATSLHVPLMMTLPGVVPSGVRETSLVTLRDLPMTILTVAGYGDEAVLPGQSLTSASGTLDVPDSIVLAELEPQDWHRFAPFEVPITRGGMQALFEGDLHYIVNGDGVEELYDVAHDPNEVDDLSSDPEFEPELSRLRSLLATLHAETEDEDPGR